jgi:hypothetical protein
MLRDMKVDWKVLLLKYISIVGKAEGVSFIDNAPIIDGLTAEETRALQWADAKSSELDYVNDIKEAREIGNEQRAELMRRISLKYQVEADSFFKESELPILEKMLRDAKVLFSFGRRAFAEAVASVVEDAFKRGDVAGNERAYAFQRVMADWSYDFLTQEERAQQQALVSDILAKSIPHAQEVAYLVARKRDVQEAVKAVAVLHDDKLQTFWRLMSADGGAPDNLTPATRAAFEAAGLDPHGEVALVRNAEERGLRESKEVDGK